MNVSSVFTNIKLNTITRNHRRPITVRVLRRMMLPVLRLFDGNFRNKNGNNSGIDKSSNTKNVTGRVISLFIGNRQRTCKNQSRTTVSRESHLRSEGIGLWNGGLKLVLIFWSVTTPGYVTPYLISKRPITRVKQLIRL